MTLALVAGRGDLPAVVVTALPVLPLVCAYEGVAVTGLAPDLTFRLETLGTLLQELRARGITEVCFAGALDRPKLDPARLDALTLPMVPLFMKALAAGDDGALRVVLGIFESHGFALRAAHEIAPQLLAQAGVHSARQPDAAMRRDAQVAAHHIHSVSAQDIGQACIVAQGRVTAMEDARGTDAMIAGLGGAQGGILFKGAKAQQSRMIDLPTVGPDTLEAAHAAGLAAVVVAAGDVLVLHRAACVEMADRHGLVFWARASA